MKSKKTTSTKSSSKKAREPGDVYDNASETDVNGQFLKFSKKQTRGWGKIDNNFLTHVRHVIDCSTSLVMSKPRLADDPTVSELLDPLTIMLKAQLQNVKVPRTKHGKVMETQALLNKLEEEAEKLVSQELELEQAIRQEERKIEALEDQQLLQQGHDAVELCVKIPDAELKLPVMTFSQPQS